MKGRNGSIIEALRRLSRAGAPAAATARSTVPWWTPSWRAIVPILHFSAKYSRWISARVCLSIAISLPSRLAQARIDRQAAEPTAALAAEHPGGTVGPEGPGSGPPRRYARHIRTPARDGQRVMRHFLRDGPNCRLPHTAPFAVAPLALGMLVTAPAAVLVALPRKAHRPTPRPPAATRRTVDMARVAAPAENHLAAAQGAGEQAGGVPHRDR